MKTIMNVGALTIKKDADFVYFFINGNLQVDQIKATSATPNVIDSKIKLHLRLQ